MFEISDRKNQLDIMTLKAAILLILGGVLANNYAFEKFLGTAPLLGYSKKDNKLLAVGLGVLAVILLSAPLAWAVQTWLLAPAGTDNAEMCADIMNTFINNEEVCSALVANEAQFSNNQAVNKKFAEDPNYGSAFLGGQNDVAVFSAMTDNIKWENHTIYDQLLNEGLQNSLQEYYRGSVSKETAMDNFYLYINEKYPTIETP